MAHRLNLINEGGAEAGRKMPADFHVTAPTTVCVLQRGEKLTSERVINETGAQVASALHSLTKPGRRVAERKLRYRRFSAMFGTII